MTKLIALALLVCALATPQTPPTVNPSALPSYMVGTGVEWNRYAAYPFGNVTSLAVRLGTSNLYSWSTADTPITATTPPQASALRTGAAYIAAQSPTGSVFLVLLGQAGLATTGNTTAAAFSGGVAVAIRVKKTHWYLMPCFRATGTSTTSTQPVPEIQAWYSFGGQ